MKSIHTTRRLALAALALGALVTGATPALADHHRDKPYASDKWTIRVDVAENASRFVFDEGPLLDSGMPAYGNSFVTQGYIYPYGTLDGTSGALADGSPEFPDLVIGEWTCRGFFVGDGAETLTGPWVITTQHFDFYAVPGFADDKQGTRANLVTDGYEIADVGVPAKRAITGGTGPFRRAGGDAVQTLLGFNDSEGVKLRFELRLR